MRIIFCFLTLLTLNCASADPRVSYEEVISGDAILLDVREESEIKLGMIKHAQWLPLSQMEESPEETSMKVKDLAQDRQIFVYCRSGKRSKVFIDHLKRFEVGAINLGGYENLLQSGLPNYIP